ECGRRNPRRSSDRAKNADQARCPATSTAYNLQSELAHQKQGMLLESLSNFRGQHRRTESDKEPSHIRSPAKENRCPANPPWHYRVIIFIYGRYCGYGG